MGIRDRVAALLGVSAFRAPALANVIAPDDDVVASIREAHGGQLNLIPQSQTRWYPRDLEAAEHAADTGDLSQAARLMRAARKDGMYSGVLSTRTGGLVRLPKRYRGNDDLIDDLKQGVGETRGVFDEMFPATELALLAADGIELGVGVAELVPVIGRDFPVMVRLAPEFLWYRWSGNQWYYRSIAGMLPIIPGDGRWILHMPGGRVAPWQNGSWRAIGRAYIRKEHAQFNSDAWEAKLANSARVAVSPQGASEEQKESWFQSVMAWGKNTVFGMTPGYDVKILESNGRGYESFQNTIKAQDSEFQIVIAGQTITTEGGSGFDNQDVHKSIRADLIKETADGLSYTVNTQGLPQWIIDKKGEEALTPGVAVEWDVTPPQDRTAEAGAMQVASQGMTQLTKALATHGLTLDAKEYAINFGIPIVTSDEDNSGPNALLFDVSLTQALELAQNRGLRPTEQAVRDIVERAGIELEDQPKGEEAPRAIPLAPTDIARVTKVVEARASIGVPPLGDDRDQLMISELTAQIEAEAEADGETDVVEAEADADIEVDDNAAENEPEPVESEVA